MSYIFAFPVKYIQQTETNSSYHAVFLPQSTIFSFFGQIQNAPLWFRLKLEENEQEMQTTCSLQTKQASNQSHQLIHSSITQREKEHDLLVQHVHHIYIIRSRLLDHRIQSFIHLVEKWVDWNRGRFAGICFDSNINLVVTVHISIL